MSMTREEAITILQHLAEIIQSGDYQEAFKMAASALRPITREQLKKTKAVFCQPCVGDFEQDTWRCSKCFVQEFGDVRGINFCPHCGAPMTDEAVDMVMERLEALRDE